MLRSAIVEVTHATAESAAKPGGGNAATPLRVGAAHDPYEHEADRIAQRIVAAVGAPGAPPVSPDAGGPVRRACGCGASCDCAGGQAAPAPVHAALASPARPLDPVERGFFEPRLGADLGSVRVHGGATAEAGTASVGASAFTVGEDVVLPERAYAAGTTAGRLLLGHELAHVLQQRAGGGPATVRRQVPSTAPAAPPTATPAPPTPEQVAANAVTTLKAIRTQLGTDVAAAQALLPPAGTINFTQVRTAVTTLNQAALLTRLDAARAAFDSARTALPADSPLVGSLRLEYADTVHAVREAMDVMHAMAETGDMSLAREENPAYADNLVAVLAASPVAAAQVGPRTAFTTDEVTASARAEADLRAVLASVVPYVNIASPSAVSAAESAITGALHRFTTRGRAVRRGAADAALVTLANAAIAQLRQGHDMMRTAAAWTTEARDALEQWRSGATGVVPDRARAAFERFVGTLDPGWAREFSARLATLARELSGAGRLYAHLNPPSSTFWCGPRTLGKALNNEFVLCRVTTVGDTVSVIVHECAHASVQVPASPSTAGMPANWSPATPPAAGTATTSPVDRAYPGERLLLDMTPAEALSNAETYTQFVFAATGRTTPLLGTIPVDTYQQFASGTEEAVRVPFARAESRSRRLENHVLGFRGLAGTVYPAWVHTEVDAAMGRTLNDAQIQTVLDDVTAIFNGFGSRRTFVAATTCAAGAVATANGLTVAADGSVTGTATSPVSTTIEVCPSFSTLPLEPRTALAFVLAGLTTAGLSGTVADLAAYARYAATIWNRDVGDLRGTPLVAPPPAAGTP